MRLVFTQYFDTEPAAAVDELDRAVTLAVEAAAARVHERPATVVTRPTSDGVRLEEGLEALAGSEVHVDADAGLTTLRVEVPWSADDRGTAKLHAANTFAHEVGRELRPAA